MIAAMAPWIGNAVMVLGGLCIVALLLTGCAYLCNFACWQIVDAYGGIKVLNEFRAWHRERASAGKE
jgi:hypothetical protein